MLFKCNSNTLQLTFMRTTILKSWKRAFIDLFHYSRESILKNHCSSWTSKSFVSCSCDDIRIWKWTYMLLPAMSQQGIYSTMLVLPFICNFSKFFQSFLWGYAVNPATIIVGFSLLPALQHNRNPKFLFQDLQCWVTVSKPS